MCRNNSQCVVTHLDRKQCSSCRYNQCLRIGMRRDLVLDESAKQERFKKYLSKKNDMKKKVEEEESKATSPEMPPLQPIASVRDPLNALLQLRNRYNSPFPFFPSARLPSSGPGGPLFPSLTPYRPPTNPPRISTYPKSPPVDSTFTPSTPVVSSYTSNPPVVSSYPQTNPLVVSNPLLQKASTSPVDLTSPNQSRSLHSLPKVSILN